jgi:hypothetical protein
LRIFVDFSSRRRRPLQGEKSINEIDASQILRAAANTPAGRNILIKGSVTGSGSDLLKNPDPGQTLKVSTKKVCQKSGFGSTTDLFVLKLKKNVPVQKCAVFTSFSGPWIRIPNPGQQSH